MRDVDNEGPVVEERLRCGRGHDLGDSGDPYRDPDCAECARVDLLDEVDNDPDGDFAR